MRTYEEIDVDAPPELVWAVMSDVARWQEWTPSVRAVEPLQEGPLRVGGRYRVRQPRLPVAVWEVTEVLPGRSFTWVNRSPGLRSTAVHAVAPDGRNGTTVRLTIEQTGVLSPLLRPYAGLVRRYVHLEAAGLQATSEQRRHDAGTTTSSRPDRTS